jgi:hypothetical protein
MALNSAHSLKNTVKPRAKAAQAAVVRAVATRSTRVQFAFITLSSSP